MDSPHQGIVEGVKEDNPRSPEGLAVDRYLSSFLVIALTVASLALSLEPTNPVRTLLLVTAGVASSLSIARLQLIRSEHEQRIQRHLEHLGLQVDRLIESVQSQPADLDPRLRPERTAVAHTSDPGFIGLVAAMRGAMREQRWNEAEELADALSRDFGDYPDVRGFREEVDLFRNKTIEELRAGLQAAQAANDPDQVLDQRDRLLSHLRAEEVRELDQQVVQWIMNLIQRRLRAGTLRGDVVELASRVAERLGNTVEGASLRAALPVLRRSAGLCPKCSRPYAGTGDSCPSCLRALANP